MIIINPAGEQLRTQLEPAQRLPSLAGKKIGIVDNTKHMAAAFLGELERLLRANYGVADFEHYRKPHASVPIPPDVVRRLVSSCDALIHGVAD